MADEWLVKAIENAAVKRATQQILTDKTMTVYGLSIHQVRALQQRFRRQTGFSPAELSPIEILKCEDK